VEKGARDRRAREAQIRDEKRLKTLTNQGELPPLVSPSMEEIAARAKEIRERKANKG